MTRPVVQPAYARRQQAGLLIAKMVERDGLEPVAFRFHVTARTVTSWACGLTLPEKVQAEAIILALDGPKE